MRVAVDAKALVAPRAGVARYVEGLRSGLAACGGSGVTTEFVMPSADRRTVAWVMGHMRRETGRGWDVTHFPFYYPPVAPRCPVTVAIHDLLFIEHPEWFPLGRANLLRWLVPAGARRAAAIVTFASATRSAIVARCRVRPEMVRVIPHGIDRERFHPASAEDVAAVRSACRLERPFVLQLGAVEPRRGFDLAVAAVADVSERVGGLELVVAGPARAAVAALEGSREGVRVIGRVEEERLAALYSAAEVVLAPSRGEGFDLPVLEALACGAVVVASDIAAHREHFADGVALFASGDAEALAAALESAVCDADRRRAMRGLALAVAERFSWEASARGHVAMWKEVGG